MLWQSDVAHWQAGGLGHSTHFNVTTTAMAPRQLLSQPHCRDGPGARSWAECGAAAHARCVAPTLDHFGANSGQKRPGIRPAWLGHGAPRERQRHRSVRRTKTAYFSHCDLKCQKAPLTHSWERKHGQQRSNSNSKLGAHGIYYIRFLL